MVDSSPWAVRMLRGDCSPHLLLMLLGANVEAVVGLILPDIAPNERSRTASIRQFDSNRSAPI